MVSSTGRLVKAVVAAALLARLAGAARGEDAALEAPTPPAAHFARRLQAIGLEDNGGSQKTEEAVSRALDWLRRHQSSDGMWRAKGFVKQCTTPCTNRDTEKHGNGEAMDSFDVGVTGLAVLAFTGRGYSHRKGGHQHRETALLKAVLGLLRRQSRSDDPVVKGSFVGPALATPRIYEHAIATAAMAELLAISRDERLRESVTNAVELCLRAQNDGSGWRYGVKPGQSDTSVTGWMVVALKTARDAGVDVESERLDKAFQGAREWLDRVTVRTGKTGYFVPGDEGSRLVRPGPYPFSPELSEMTAVGVYSRLLVGQDRSEDVVRQGVDLLLAEVPRWQEQEGKRLSRVNHYYWYYGTNALHQFGRRGWKEWNEAVQTALLDSQRKGGDEDGSWDPIGEWGAAGGRVYSTALGALTLETYYRFPRVGG